MTLDIVPNLQMKGENSTILGSVGDYEIGAKWKWKIQFHTISKVFLGASVLFLFLIMAIAYTFMGLQFARLCTKEAELTEIRLEILKVHSEVQSELQAIKKLREELNTIAEVTSNDNLFYRKKRSIIADSDQGNLLPINKSKNSKPKVKKISTNKRSKQNTLLHPYQLPPKTQTSSASQVMTAVHLERNVSFSVTGSNGIINRWHPQYWSPSVVESVQLENQNSSLIIPSAGLYLIYAQLCYGATKENNSFEVRLMNQGAKNSQSKIIAQCSAGTTILDNDITCFTSVAQVLQTGDRVYLQQIQKNRHVLMNMGRSFMGLVKLSN